MATIKNHTGSPKKLNVFSFLKYEHLVAGISGGVTSTLILHPLDLIKIRFAGKQSNWRWMEATLMNELAC